MKKTDTLDNFHLLSDNFRTAKHTSASIVQQQYPPSVPQTSFIPILLEHPQMEMEYHLFSEDSRTSMLLLDSYQIRNTTPEELYYPILPSPCMCLYFKLSSHFAQAVFCGMTSTLSSLQLPPGSTIFCVRFHPGISDFFTKTSAKKLTDCTFPMNVFLPSTPDLIQDIRHNDSFAERVFRIQTYFMSHPYISEYENHPLFTRGVEMIHQHHGILRVSDIAETLDCSERYLCRMFNQWVGTSTKQYCELIQLQFSLREILSNRPRTLAKTAASFGYFDQPHMNRIYQKFLGRTASDMLFFNTASCNISCVPVIL